MRSTLLMILLALVIAASSAGCGDGAGGDGEGGGSADVTGGVDVAGPGADAAGDVGVARDATFDVEADTPLAPYDTSAGDDTSSDVSSDVTEDAAPVEPERVVGYDPPPAPADSLGYEPPERAPDGEAPTPEEIEAFTRRLMAFYRETNYWDWVYWTTHGLDESYDPDMMPYRLWWQDTSIRRDGELVTFSHRRYAENIVKRSIKVLDGAASGYMLTGDTRMRDVAIGLMHGLVALSLGFDSAQEDPPVKYLQARAIWTHDHEFEVDGRRVAVDYGPAREPGSKWNVHSLPLDNPEYGEIWVSNMRSKDDVPYMFHAVHVATRVYHATDDEELRAAARLFIEYMRGFAQRIVDDDWFILTRYEDGQATIAVDTTKDSQPPADLGSFVHWQAIFGEDAECNAQLGAALAGYGYLAGKGHCERGQIGAVLEEFATTGNWFNHNIYNYFHMAALSTAQLWGYDDIAEQLMDGLVERFEDKLFDPTTPNWDHREYASDTAGWLVTAASQGYPLTAREARHIMEWYGNSADWYREWEHWDPWASLPDGQELRDHKPPRKVTLPDGEGGEIDSAYVRIVEMPYVFEYCWSPLKAANSVPFIDCDIVADPTQW